MVWNDCMLYVKFVCVKLMYVKFVCVKLLYVKFIVVYVRRREEEKELGIQNQKQEPHTKMWGTKLGSKPNACKKTHTWLGRYKICLNHLEPVVSCEFSRFYKPNDPHWGTIRRHDGRFWRRVTMGACSDWTLNFWAHFARNRIGALPQNLMRRA